MMDVRTRCPSHFLLTIFSGNGSDVFGSDICTCKPYHVYAIEEGIRGAQKGIFTDTCHLQSSNSFHFPRRCRRRRLLPEGRSCTRRSDQVRNSLSSRFSKLTNHHTFTFTSMPFRPVFIPHPNTRSVLRVRNTTDTSFTTSANVAGTLPTSTSNRPSLLRA